MNVEELLALTRPMTDEEAAFMEQEVLKASRRLVEIATEINDKYGESAPELTGRLLSSARTTLANIEEATSL